MAGREDEMIDPTQNITITGFMGTGKSTVAALLAQRLGRPLVDMDQQLVTHFGKSIPEIFAQEGELAFRQAEAQLCRQLAQEQGLVIATGGGALVNPENRQLLAQSGPIVCLTASVDEILDRLESARDRPLLPQDREARRQQIQALLEYRRAAYASIPLQVETTGRSPEAILEAVLEALAGHQEAPGMSRITVPTPQGSYHICLGEGLLAQVGRLLVNRGIRPGKAAIVTNPDVGPHHAEPVAASLEAAGFQPVLCTVPEGEQHKTLATVATLYDQFLAGGLDRHSPVLALGGGVVGDMAGFAAATYLRGVPFVPIPTSLLAMVDASVGGKTGVDLPQGKNLVGAFKQPRVVIIDPAVLSTLPGEEFRAGLAEVVKHGIIGAPALFQQLEGARPASLGQLIPEAVQVKVDVVAQDPFEQGRRAVLNLGHTFGHALELVSQFRLRHGEAVAVGLVAAAEMAAILGRCDPALVSRIRALLERLGLPVALPGYDLDAVHQAMAHDKKRKGRTLRFVIPQALGDVVVIDDPGEAVVQEALGRVIG